MDAIGSRPWFGRYVDAFNARDYDAFGAYYHPEVDFRGQAATLAGRAMVMEFYRRIHEQVVETVEVRSVVGSTELLAAELVTTLVSKGDWPDFPRGGMRKGERRQSVNFAFYDIKDGLFVRIRTANFSRSVG
ncbi:nuclear transport factor 2 family protein [Aurantiacibacter suaedae]|uniref:nuclear transport factor 2 family protein n=1 Tax=Aurantiacibacter suaedae TaxID=2545755 RepID=UPI0013868B6E|nr:nuclear transport factor 2 family protein [Aurantiacibacter suaedae]